MLVYLRNQAEVDPTHKPIALQSTIVIREGDHWLISEEPRLSVFADIDKPCGMMDKAAIKTDGGQVIRVLPCGPYNIVHEHLQRTDLPAYFYTISDEK